MNDDKTAVGYTDFHMADWDKKQYTDFVAMYGMPFADVGSGVYVFKHNINDKVYTVSVIRNQILNIKEIVGEIPPSNSSPPTGLDAVVLEACRTGL